MMRTVVCLRIEACKEVLDACAALTPTVEPQEDCVWMDWSGCGPVPRLAERLATRLGTQGRAFHLGVAPLKFAAGVLAGLASEKRPCEEVQAIAGGWWLEEEPASFVRQLPVQILLDVDREALETLARLGVHTLGQLDAIPAHLLRQQVGHDAERLRSWARGDDPRAIRARYPPKLLRKRIAGDLVDRVGTGAGGGDGARLKSALSAAVAEHADELSRAGQSCHSLAVAVGDRRLERTFSPPVAEVSRLARAAWRLVSRMELSGDPAALAAGYIVEIVPVPVDAGHQGVLWDEGGMRREDRERALHLVRDRWGDEAIWVAADRMDGGRYDRMLNLYEG